MTTPFTDEEIDVFGERLRQGAPPDIRKVYGAYMGFLNELRAGLLAELRGLMPGYEVNSRLKRMETVAAKLWRRPELRLSQMPDVVGCRVIVPDRDAQIAIVERLASAYNVRQLDDKSDDPKFGYRAVIWTSATAKFAWKSRCRRATSICGRQFRSKPPATTFPSSTVEATRKSAGQCWICRNWPGSAM